jgi:hypothetical protein
MCGSLNGYVDLVSILGKPFALGRAVSRCSGGFCAANWGRLLSIFSTEPGAITPPVTAAAPNLRHGMSFLPSDSRECVNCGLNTRLLRRLRVARIGITPTQDCDRPGGSFGPDFVAMGTSSDAKTADIGPGKQIGRKLHLEVSTIIKSSSRIYRDLRRTSCAKRSVPNRDL